ncbi:MAG: hypothetical protein ACFB50_08240 [Rubrobacteraceae bacterium]
MIGFNESRFDDVLRFLMQSRSLRGPEDLSRLLKEKGREVTAEKITAHMEGREWVDASFPRWIAEGLDLNAWEMGLLAHAVAYGQVHPP